jgi:hypothetical protein
MADRDEVKWLVILRQRESGLQLFVVEGADGDPDQVQGDRLKQQVLGSVAGFEMHVTGSPLAVLDLGALVDGTDHKHGWRFA